MRYLPPVGGIMAVLNCITTDSGQEKVMAEILRVLKPGGILYISDYPIQPDAGNQRRYQKFRNESAIFGVFRIPDGEVFRHSNLRWIHKLIAQLEVLWEGTADIYKMNEDAAHIFQIMAQKNNTALKGANKIQFVAALCQNVCLNLLQGLYH